MPIRYLLRGQVVEVEPRSDVLALGIVQNHGPGDPRLFIERRTAAEHLSRLILEHRDHPSLLRDDDAMQRLIGLNCSCEQPAFTVRMPISLVLLASQEVRDLIRRSGSLPLPRYVRSKKERQTTARAEKRARDLLHQLLTREQRWRLRAEGSFEVTGQDGKTYLIRKGMTVQLLEGGSPVTSYCIHPREPLPALDVMLAQKLLLERDIGHFMANANATPCRSFQERLADALDESLAAARAEPEARLAG